MLLCFDYGKISWMHCDVPSSHKGANIKTNQSTEEFRIFLPQLFSLTHFITRRVFCPADWPYRQVLPHSVWTHGPRVGHRLVSSQ